MRKTVLFKGNIAITPLFWQRCEQKKIVNFYYINRTYKQKRTELYSGMGIKQGKTGKKLFVHILRLDKSNHFSNV